MTCPECGSEKGFFLAGAFVECKEKSCYFTQQPADDLLIEAALKTYQREQGKAGTK